MPVNQPFSFFVQWHLTERCNLACAHCYQTGNFPEEMDYSTVVDVMEQIEGTLSLWSGTYGIDFAPSINFTGGEPFLREDLFRILVRARDHGFSVYLLTNGTLVGEGEARELGAAGVEGVQVSIEGPRKVHDLLRGDGSFNRSLSGVDRLVSAGIAVTLNVTFSRVNAPYFREIIDLARELKVRRLGFSRLVPSGSGSALAESMLSPQETETLYREIFSQETEGLEIVTGDPVASQMRDKPGAGTEGVPWGGCAAAVSGITLLPDGILVPCRRLPIPVGNILTDSLREVWATSEVLQGLRKKESYRGRCGGCERWSTCRGCRAIAYAASLLRGEGDYLAEDPQCFFLQ